MTDSDIVIAYRSGKESAFDDLMNRYVDRIYAFALRLSGDTHCADDVVAETFIKVWKKLDSFNTEKNFTAWIFTIARNTTFDILRKRKDVAFSRMLHDDEESEIDIPDEAILADEIFDREVSRDVLERALAQLPLSKRSIVLLHDIDGLTFSDIAGIIDAPLNTVKSQYRRALLSLKKHIEGTMHQKRVL